jgi:hypothetical protein
MHASRAHRRTAGRVARLIDPSQACGCQGRAGSRIAPLASAAPGWTFRPRKGKGEDPKSDVSCGIGGTNKDLSTAAVKLRHTGLGSTPSMASRYRLTAGSSAGSTDAPATTRSEIRRSDLGLALRALASDRTLDRQLAYLGMMPPRSFATSPRFLVWRLSSLSRTSSRVGCFGSVANSTVTSGRPSMVCARRC